jgi:hypothetical protein
MLSALETQIMQKIWLNTLRNLLSHRKKIHTNSGSSSLFWTLFGISKVEKE